MARMAVAISAATPNSAGGGAGVAESQRGGAPPKPCTFLNGQPQAAHPKSLNPTDEKNLKNSQNPNTPYSNAYRSPKDPKAEP